MPDVLELLQHRSGPLAQLVEHLPFKQGVAGSNPARLIDSKEEKSSERVGLFHARWSNDLCSFPIREDILRRLTRISGERGDLGNVGIENA